MNGIVTKRMSRLGLQNFIKTNCPQAQYQVSYLLEGDAYQIAITKIGEILEHEEEEIVETDDTE